MYDSPFFSCTLFFAHYLSADDCQVVPSANTIPVGVAVTEAVPSGAGKAVTSRSVVPLALTKSDMAAESYVGDVSQVE